MKMRQIYYLPFLVFDIGDQKYGLHHCGGVEGVYIHAHHFHEIGMLHTMSATCSKVATKLWFELSHKFLDANIMAIFGMVYP
jgi:hypothetical protein